MPIPQAFLLVALSAAPLAAAEGDPLLDRTTVPAAGRQSAQLTVGRFGRYALSVKSAQGVSVQVVDRMAGPGDSAGRPGEEDGRIDVFLERGEYRLLTEGHPRATGEARLDVRAFSELSGDEPRVLVETRLEEATLDDHEQRSYWLVAKERRRVVLEAAGRNLSDLRLWRDGQWLVDAAPKIERLQPKVGRPVLACRLVADLELGAYRVTAYGGPAQPWAEEGDAHPLFYVRLGVPRLPEAGRRRFAVGPFGVDRYLVPGTATYFRLELPEALPATLRAGDLDPAQPFALPPESREITKKSLPPAAELDLPRSDDPEPRREDTPPPPRVHVPGRRGLLHLVHPLGSPAGLGGRDRAARARGGQAALARRGGGGGPADRVAATGQPARPPHRLPAGEGGGALRSAPRGARSARPHRALPRLASRPL